MACGESFGIVEVFISEDIDGNAITKALERVRSVLAPHNIKFSHRCVSPKIQNFQCPGSAVTSSSCQCFGTLGGFSWGTNLQADCTAIKDKEKHKREEKSLFALISGHVSKVLDGPRLEVNGRSFGIIMDPVWSHENLDIASIKVDAIDISEENRLFRNENGSPSPCKVITNCDLALVPKIVHFNGAKTKLGLGEILLERCFFKNENNSTGHYIAFGDRMSYGVVSIPFCKEGDSGAIVCANDKRGKFVHVIAMIIGKFTDNKSLENIYLALNMHEGLIELKARYNHQFVLCGEQ